MNDKFDELAKSMAQSVTRRAALKKFGVGLAAFALAALGLPNKAEATKGKQPPWVRRALQKNGKRIPMPTGPGVPLQLHHELAAYLPSLSEATGKR